MLVEIVESLDAMSERATEIVAAQLRQKPDSVIGFATGSTPLGLYERLIEQHRERGLVFS